MAGKVEPKNVTGIKVDEIAELTPASGVTIESACNFDAAVTMDSTLSVTGNVTAPNLADLSANETVTGSWTFNNDITVGGNVDGVDVAQLKTDFDAINTFTFSSWTPTYGSASGTLSNGSATIARYLQVGKLVFFYLNFTFDLASSTSDWVSFTLPVTASANADGGNTIWAARTTDATNGPTAGGGRADIQTTTVARVYQEWDANASDWTIDTGHRVVVTGMYEAA